MATNVADAGSSYTTNHDWNVISNKYFFDPENEKDTFTNHQAATGKRKEIVVDARKSPLFEVCDEVAKLSSLCSECRPKIIRPSAGFCATKLHNPIRPECSVAKATAINILPDGFSNKFLAILLDRQPQIPQVVNPRIMMARIRLPLECAILNAACLFLTEFTIKDWRRKSPLTWLPTYGICPRI
ncbi:hypothetical protein HNY73_015272 [Argiope bruennichi]|uniref:Uncharacterized protein n=1 Tax=Argiope bruennichi TaxID=94029 RepID=A0A8T0EVZ9_ARGBR|nr:hypothetical protein HNY73_015272 [Argiope bruennichi]